MTLPRTTLPSLYLGSIALPYSPMPEDAVEWGHRWIDHVRAHAPHEEIDEFDKETRLAVYDAMDDGLRDWFETTWRAEANEWVDATAGLFGDDPNAQGTGGWRNVERIATADGGLLVLYPHNEEDAGTAIWMEAVRFGYAEVGSAAGVTVPQVWDVR